MNVDQEFLKATCMVKTTLENIMLVCTKYTCDKGAMITSDFIKICAKDSELKEALATVDIVMKKNAEILTT